MKMTRKCCGLLAVTSVLVLSRARLWAVPLSTLFDGQTITANDTLFSAFTLRVSQTTNGGVADTSQIDVTPLTNDPLDPGINFTTPPGALGTPSAHQGPSSVLLTFSFDVSTLSQLPLIKDNSLLIDGFGFDSGPLALIQVSEQVFDAAGAPLGTQQALATNQTQVGDASLFDSITFPPQALLHVVKTIVMSGPEDNDHAVLTMFEQRFSQALAGDYNHNGVVDAADYVVWRKGTGSQSEYDIWRANFGHSVAAPPVTGDYNHNGIVDAADYVVWRKGLGTTYLQNDYAIWRSHFGETASSGSGVITNVAVPEPATIVMLMLAVAGWCLRQGRPA
jgi:hypothetical protein